MVGVQIGQTDKVPGGDMKLFTSAWLGCARRSSPALALVAAAMAWCSGASAQSFRVQCPETTVLHPNAADKSNGSVKCQQIAGTDGFATMADGTQIYLFGFGPLSGVAANYSGAPGTMLAADFNAPFNNTATSNAGMYEPADMMNWGVLSAQQPAPLMAIDEGDEFFLTLTNTGQIMRPDLFEQHTVHFHGYPNAAPYFDGVPDASIAINIMGSYTYYYTAPDAGTYFWHCHITPPEHLQMGMVGQLFVRPRQNRVAVGADLGAALKTRNLMATGSPDGKTCSDLLCTGQTPLPAAAWSTGVSGVTHAAGSRYAYNDGDGSTRYDVAYPIQLMGFDPNFHYVGMTFNPEAFADMKDKYFLLNGRGYPDTVNTNVDNQGAFDRLGVPIGNGPLATVGADGATRATQPMAAKIAIPLGGRALLRLSELNITDFHTLATLGIPMTVIANNARLLRDLSGNNLYYKTNSVTMGGGESIDVILDASDTAAYPVGSTFFVYSTKLDHLSNDAENFGGMMTEIVIYDPNNANDTNKPSAAVLASN
jgi:FtsP/CotA-like multicopper oxidase with cupredoxin domain